MPLTLPFPAGPPPRFTDQKYAAQVYDCAAFLLFGDDGACNLGAESARQWLPQLKDLPTMHAVAQLRDRSAAHSSDSGDSTYSSSSRQDTQMEVDARAQKRAKLAVSGGAAPAAATACEDQLLWAAAPASASGVGWGAATSLPASVPMPGASKSARDARYSATASSQAPAPQASHRRQLMPRQSATESSLGSSSASPVGAQSTSALFLSSSHCGTLSPTAAAAAGTLPVLLLLPPCASPPTQPDVSGLLPLSPGMVLAPHKSAEDMLLGGVEHWARLNGLLQHQHPGAPLPDDALLLHDAAALQGGGGPAALDGAGAARLPGAGAGAAPVVGQQSGWPEGLGNGSTPSSILMLGDGVFSNTQAYQGGDLHLEWSSELGCGGADGCDNELAALFDEWSC